MEVPKRMSMAAVGVYLIKDIEDLWMAWMVAAIIIAAMACQTYTDIKGKKAVGENVSADASHV